MSKEITNEELAKMVKLGFDGQDKHFNKRFDDQDKKFNKRFDRIEKQINILGQGFSILEQGQEEIKLRLDNVAYRFELRDLEKTVKSLALKIKKLEEKI